MNGFLFKTYLGRRKKPIEEDAIYAFVPGDCLENAVLAVRQDDAIWRYTGTKVRPIKVRKDTYKRWQYIRRNYRPIIFWMHENAPKRLRY